MMNIFKKWKEKINRCKNEYEIAHLTYRYKNVEFDSPIQIDDIFLVKDKDDLIFFCKKDNWNKYIGFNRYYLSDLDGNTFPQDNCYKSVDLKEIKQCNLSDISKELIEKTIDELIKYKKDIEVILENKRKEEFYKI